MILPNPCCVPLKDGVIFLATAEIIIALGWMIYNLFETPHDAIGISLMAGFFCSENLVEAAKQENKRKCSFWLILTMCIYVFLISNLGRSIWLNGLETNGIQRGLICIIVFKTYQTYVVICFAQELLRSNQGIETNPTSLPKGNPYGRWQVA